MYSRDNPMAVTLTVNYRDTLKADTVAKIDELIEDNYCLDDMLEFIDEYIPEGIVVDWEQTWEANLRYDYTDCSDGTSYHPIHIFSNH